MKIRYKFYTAILAIGLLSACSDGFDNINKEYLPDLDPAESDLVFALKSGSTYGGAHLHQRIKNISIDAFSQYFENGSINRTWTPNDGYNIDYWTDHYRWLLHTNSSIESTKDNSEKVNLNSVARIWRTYMQSQFLDFFGPAPLPLAPAENSDYIALKDQYTFFFKELSEAAAAISTEKPFVSTPTQDLIYKGDLSKWQRFANSLHLRLAIKLSEIDPELCKQEINNALKGAGGLMQNNNDNAEGPIMNNGLWGQQYNYYMYQQSWGGKEVMTTTMEKILTNLGGLPFKKEEGVKEAPEKVDPRGIKYFAASPSGIWQGIPVGLNASETTTDKPLLDKLNTNYAYLSPVWVVKDNTKPIDLFMYTEVCFLMAEANERGFVASGSAEEWYNKGITASMESWGIPAADTQAYLKSTDKNNWGTSVAYTNNTGNGNTKLEKIITQKYIANFPDVALEAWNDKRRLNLPAFDTPKYTSPSAGTYPLDKNIQNPNNFISRMAYPQQEVFVNKDKYEAGVALLGTGGDKTSTPLWWASKRSNYVTSVTN